MVAIEFNIIVNEIIRGLQNNFILALKSGLNILRLLPSYKINEKDINEFKEKIKSIIEKN